MTAEEKVLVILAELLGIEVDSARSFIAQGGDSIRAMQASSRARRQAGLEIAAETLLNAESLEAAIAAAARAPREEEVDEGPMPDGERPASRGQQQLWFVEQIGESGAVYNVSTAIHLRGEFDLGLLEQAGRETLSAHEALRTTFREGPMELERNVLDPEAIGFEVLDLRDLRAEEAEAAYEEAAAQASSAPFSLSEGPVSRIALVARGEGLCTIVLVAHHSAIDAWTLGLLCEEVVERYLALRDGSAYRPREAPPYDAFVRTEARAKREHGARDLDWWVEYLAGAPTTVALPTRQPRPECQSFSGARLRFELGPPDPVRAAARSLGVTPFTFLFAAFAVCLAERSRLRDFLIGISIAGRQRGNFEEMVGFFAKTLPVRVALEDDEEPFADLARRLQTSITAVLEHSTADLSELGHATGAVGDTARNPVVQIVFAKHDDLIARGEVGRGVELDFEDLGTGSSPFDLTFYVERMDSIGIGAMEYASVALTDSEANEFAALVVAAIASLAVDPKQKLGSAIASVAELPQPLRQ